MVFLETKRLLLRKFREEDFSGFCAWAMDEETCRMMGRDLPETEADARAAFDWLKDREERGYGLVLKESGQVIGNLTVAPVPEHLAGQEALAGKRGRSLSFSISREYRRQGLMREAVEAVIARLFAEEGMDYVQCGYFQFNTASRYFQERLGFTRLAAMALDIRGRQTAVVENMLWRERFPARPTAG